jgi:hypothetical protein
MNITREVRLLRKELAFLDARRKSFRHDIRTVTVGRVTALVNGLASRHLPHIMYLNRRIERAYERLKVLTSVGPCW